MTPYRKNLVAAVTIWTLAMSMGIAFVYVSAWFALPFILIILLANQVTKRITCPNCGTPITHVEKGVFGWRTAYIALYSKKCQQCGWELNR